MKRLLASSGLFVATCLGMWTAHRAIALAAEGADSAAMHADKALQSALGKKDTKALGALLDQRFTWTDEDGKTWPRGQFLTEAAGSATAGAGYSDVKEHDYGALAVVTGTGKRAGHPDTFFARVWIKRPIGWLLLTHQDTAIIAKSVSSAAAPAAGSSAAAQPDCDNPCRTLPVSPKTAGEKAVFKAYQDVETAVTSHDAKTWAYHVADEFVGIGRQYTGSPDTKAARVGQIGVVSNRVVLPKMLSGEAFVFGDAAIIIADHQPVGEPPYHVIRVWVNRDGRWQLFHRQETIIK
jgi:Domain of unknown function (DUF4440)